MSDTPRHPGGQPGGQPSKKPGNSGSRNDAKSGKHPDVGGAPDKADQLSRVVHDIANLLDGSMRTMAQATKSLDTASASAENTELTSAMDRLRVVNEAMNQMCELLHGAMYGGGAAAWSPTAARARGARPLDLGEAIEHVTEVLAPEAKERSVVIETDLRPDAAGAAAGPMYSVILNGVKNAIESIARRGGPGTVRIAAASLGVSGIIRIDITDDGEGVPEDRGADGLPRRTAKGSGHGMGLRLSADLVRETGGVMRLTSRSDDKPGAVLRISYLPPEDLSDKWIGKNED